MGTSLTVIERAAVAFGDSFQEKQLKSLVEESKEIVAITNEAGYQQCHAARMKLKNQRIAITKTGKDVRDDANAFSKAVIALEKRFLEITTPEEERLQAIQDAHDAKIEAEKAAKAEAEARRIAFIQDRIADLVAIPSSLVGKTSDLIAIDLSDLALIHPEEWAQEFLPIANDALAKTTSALQLMHAGTLAQEQAKAAEEARAKAEREELAKLRAEQEERNRQEILQRAEAERVAKAQREAEEAAAKAVREAEAEKLAAERAEFERERQAQIEADRYAQAVSDAKAAEVRAEQQAEAKLLQYQRDELARQQEAIEAQRKASEPTPAPTNTTAGLASASANEGIGETPALSQRETLQSAPMTITSQNIASFRASIDDLLDCLFEDDLQKVLEFVDKLVEKMEIAA